MIFIQSMSPILPINELNLQIKYGVLSNYSQSFLKTYVKSLSFILDRFIRDFDSKIKLQTEQKLKEIGIKQVGGNTKEGVLITDNEFDYQLFSLSDGYLGFNILKPDSNQLLRHFRLNNRGKYAISGDFSNLNIEDEITKVIDFVDRKLFDAKKAIKSAPNPQPYIPKQTEKDKIAELKGMSRRQEKAIVAKAGIVGLKEKELIETINEKFKLIQELYKNISDGRTKYKVKKSYKNYNPQPVANKLGFKDIGPSGEDISLFRTSYRNDTHTVITVSDKNGEESIYAISQDIWSVQKNLPSKFVQSPNSGYRICLTPKYYTQKEVDKSNLYSYLSCLNKEMEQFIEHTQNWLNKREERRLIRSNYDVANLDKYNKILDDIHSSFKQYQAKMRKYLRKPNKSRKFKSENNISTKITTTAVKFDNITHDGYDLRLSYPKVRNSVATQLLVMSGDEIKNSFYIINNKLLRFDIKDLNDKITHNNRKFYYYDNKYLQNSNLQDYLLLLKEKLQELNEKLDVIREKQIENRIKYHIKTKKEE